jgi:hypothetical protein
LPQRLLFLGGLLCSLGDLARTTLVGLDHGLDDTVQESVGFIMEMTHGGLPNSNGLSHVTNGETTKRWVVGEGLDTHGLGWNHLDNGSITRLDELGRILGRLASSAINLLKQLGEFASNVSSVAIKDWCVTCANLTGVVEDDDLGVERVGTLRWVVLRVTSDVATTNFLDRDVLDVEANIVTWNTFDELFVVHFDGLDFSGDVGGSECDDHTSLDDTSFNTADRNRANTRDLVHILEWETEWLISRSGGSVDGVNGLKESLATGLGLGLLLPTLVPRCIGGNIDHVVAVEAGDGDERNGLWVVADLLDEVGSLLDDFVESILRPFGGVHLVDGDDELLDTKGVCKKSVLTSLAILGDTSFELTNTGGDDENGTISLRCTSDHVLDEVTVTWGVDDSNHVFGGLELPEGDIDSDTTLTLGLQFVKNPGIFE